MSKDKKKGSYSMAEFEVRHLGSGQLERELKLKIEEMSAIVGDTETYGDKAKGVISLNVTIRREDRNVIVSSQIHEKPPKVRPRSTLLWLDPKTGKLVTQDPSQVTLDDVLGRKSEDGDGEDEGDDEESNREHS